MLEPQPAKNLVMAGKSHLNTRPRNESHGFIISDRWKGPGEAHYLCSESSDPGTTAWKDKA